MKQTIAKELLHLVIEAERRGVIVTVEQVSMPPLAIGHYRSVITVRDARGPAVAMMHAYYRPEVIVK